MQQQREDLTRAICLTAMEVTENISRILSNGTPRTTPSQPPYKGISADCSTASVFHFNFASAAVAPDFLHPSEYSPNAEVVQNFAVSLNSERNSLVLQNLNTLAELDSSTISYEKGGDDDDVIWLDSTTSQTEGSAPNDAMAGAHPSSLFSAADSFVPTSACLGHFDAGPTVATTAAFSNYSTNGQKSNAIDKWWNDKTIATLLNHYAEWSIKYPRRRGGLSLLVDAVQKRACEIGAHTQQIKEENLKSRIVSIRKQLRKEMKAQQKLLQEQNIMAMQQQQRQTTRQTNSPTNDDVEILGYYECGRANTTSEETLETHQQNNYSSFPRTDEFVLENANVEDKNCDVGLQISEFDDFFKRWVSNYEQVEKKRESNEKEESATDEAHSQIRRGPVIRCPRMPKIRIRLKRIAAEDIKK